MVRLLFVDDDPNIIQGLRRVMRSLGGQLTCVYAGNGAEALSLLEQQPCDVIAADLVMPGMDGVTLLAEVRRRWPHMLRIITSGRCGEEHAIRTVDVAHQFVAKPYETATLQAIVTRATRFRSLVAEPSLAAFISGIDRLPSLPEAHRRICDAIQDETRSVQEIGAVVAQDVALSAKLLQMVNSAFFALPRSVTSPVDAAVLLGTNVIRGLVMADGVFGSARDVMGTELGRRLWDHSIEVGGNVRSLARQLHCQRSAADAAFLGGIMHDVGTLVFLMSRPREYAECARTAVASGRCIARVEQEMFGTTHAHVAAYLLGTWGLPENAVNAVAFHHTPSECKEPGAELSLLHLADVPPDAGSRTNVLDLGYIESVGLTEQLPELLASAVAKDS